jgi:transposase
VLEGRRRQALALLDDGLSLNAVARRLGCAPSSVMRWRNVVRRQGARGFEVRTSPGRPPKLTARQRRQLVRLLLQGPLAQGYRTDLWTTARVAEVIQRHFGIRYHPDHVGRLLHALDWSPQKPERRALQRDDAAIARWKRTDWPRVKKTPRGWGPTSSS